MKMILIPTSTPLRCSNGGTRLVCSGKTKRLLRRNGKRLNARRKTVPFLVAKLFAVLMMARYVAGRP